MAKLDRHVFVCINERDPSAPRGSCSHQGAALQGVFKEQAASAGLKGSVRANKSGCLDQCEHGPVVVVYPEQVWYGFVQPGDVEEIVQEHLLNGRPVERLRLSNSCVNTATCMHKQAMGKKSEAGPGKPDQAEDVALSGVL